VQKEITILVDVCNLFPWCQFREEEKKSLFFKSAYSAELIERMIITFLRMEKNN